MHDSMQDVLIALRAFLADLAGGGERTAFFLLALAVLLLAAWGLGRAAQVLEEATPRRGDEAVLRTLTLLFQGLAAAAAVLFLCTLAGLIVGTVAMRVSLLGAVAFALGFGITRLFRSAQVSPLGKGVGITCLVALACVEAMVMSSLVASAHAAAPYDLIGEDEWSGYWTIVVPVAALFFGARSGSTEG
jgi:hypothetical protein